MNERPVVPYVIELDGNTDLNPLILGLASMLAQRVIARAKARARQDARYPRSSSCSVPRTSR